MATKKMATKKMTINELRKLVRQIVKENDNFDMDKIMNNIKPLEKLKTSDSYILKATKNIPSDGQYLKGTSQGNLQFTDNPANIIIILKGKFEAEQELSFMNNIFGYFGWVLEPYSK